MAISPLPLLPSLPSPPLPSPEEDAQRVRGDQRETDERGEAVGIVRPLDVEVLRDEGQDSAEHDEGVQGPREDGGKHCAVASHHRLQHRQQL